MTTERSRRRGDRRDRGDRQKDEEKRGRSRDRREKQKGRSRDRGRRRETDKSHGSKPLLVPAETAPPPAPSADAAAPKVLRRRTTTKKVRRSRFLLRTHPYSHLQSAPRQSPRPGRLPRQPVQVQPRLRRWRVAKVTSRLTKVRRLSVTKVTNLMRNTNLTKLGVMTSVTKVGTTTRLVGMTAASAAAKSEVELPARGNIAGQLTIWLLMSTGTTKRPFPGRIVSRKGNAGACTSGRRTKQVRRMTHCPTSLRKSKGLQFQ